MGSMRARLARVSGIAESEIARVRETFAPRLRVSADTAWRAIDRHPAAEPPSLVVPDAFADMLAAALAHHDDEALRVHYLDTMPRVRVEQMATRAEPNATLFHTRLDWDRLPRLTRALDRLATLLGPVPREATLAALYARTYYGGFMPLLYGYPADLAHAARALVAGAELHDVIDRYLTAPIVHELTHASPSREAIFPIYLDECIAGSFGVWCHRGFAYPEPGEDTGLYAAPWLTQVGQALTRAFGRDAIARAHAGAAPWEAAIPAALLDELAARGWAEYARDRRPHFLSDNFRPAAWLAPILAHIDEETDEDLPILEDGLRAMCLRNFLSHDAFRVETAAPQAPIQIDLSTLTTTSAFDPVPLSYWFPPPIARRLQAAGIHGYSVTLRDPRSVPALARVLRDGAEADGAEYTVKRWPASS
jgi:hypothetical protein